MTTIPLFFFFFFFILFNLLRVVQIWSSIKFLFCLAFFFFCVCKKFLNFFFSFPFFFLFLLLLLSFFSFFSSSSTKSIFAVLNNLNKSYKMADEEVSFGPIWFYLDESIFHSNCYCFHAVLVVIFLLFQVQHKQKSDSMFEDPESQAWIRVKEPTILSSFCFNTFFICTLLESFKHE